MPENKEAVIISAARTPTGKFQGALKSFSAPDLGALVVRESVRRAGVPPEEIDERIKVRDAASFDPAGSVRDHDRTRAEPRQQLGCAIVAKQSGQGDGVRNRAGAVSAVDDLEASRLTVSVPRTHDVPFAGIVDHLAAHVAAPSAQRLMVGSRHLAFLTGQECGNFNHRFGSKL